MSYNQLMSMGVFQYLSNLCNRNGTMTRTENVKLKYKRCPIHALVAHDNVGVAPYSKIRRR